MVGLGQHLADLLVREQRRPLELHPSQIQVELGTLAAAGLRRAEAAPVAGHEVVGALHGHDGAGRDFLLAPEQQLLQDDDLAVNVVEAGLDDGGLHGVEVVEIAEQRDGAQAVEAELGVVLGLDLDAFAVLQVDDLDHAAADDHGVGSAEALRDPLGKIEALLDHQLGAFAGCGELLQDGLDIEVGGLVHLAVVVVVLLDLGQALLVLGVGDLMQGVAELQLGQAVGQGALVGVAAGAGIRALVRQCDGSGAVDPAIRGRCRAAGVFSRHWFPPLRGP